MVWGLSLKGLILPLMAVFIMGWIAASIFYNYSYIGLEKPLSFDILLGVSPELSSPSDHIPEEGIHVLKDKVVLDIKDAQWASFTDTNSMDPFIDAGANSIEIKPESGDEIRMGDVISFKADFDDGIIIHRVIGVGNDEQGTYYITKGDNNPMADPGKVRFENIHGIVVAVVY